MPRASLLLKHSDIREQIFTDMAASYDFALAVFTDARGLTDKQPEPFLKDVF